MKKQDERSKVMKFWVTKYALTKGIFQIRARRVKFSNRTEFISEETSKCYGFHGKEGRDCFIDLEDAKNNAKARALRKILSLQRQIDSLNKFTFAPKMYEKPTLKTEHLESKPLLPRVKKAVKL